MFARVARAVAAVRPVTLGARLARHASTYEAVMNPTAGLPASAVEYHAVAKDFAAAELTPAKVAKWDEEHYFPVDEFLRKAANLGFAAMYVPTEHGGTGLTREESIPVLEALAGADTSTTAYLTIHNMVAWAVSTFGSAEVRERFLPGITSMQTLTSYCLTEPNSGSDAASLATKAVRDGDSYVLNGSKAFISGGGRSDLYMVMARTSDKGANGISCFLVPHPTPGLTFGKNERKMGWRTQPTSAVFFEDVRVPAANMVGQEGDGFRIAMRALNGGRLSIASCSLGAAAACLDLTRDHVRGRKQFGKPLAAQQAMQFKVADMATKLVSARLMVHHAARLLDAKDPAAAATCAMAKKAATDSGFEVVNEALQAAGGYGYLADYPYERFLRDVRVHRILEGTNEIMNVITSRALLADE